MQQLSRAQLNELKQADQFLRTTRDQPENQPTPTLPAAGSVGSKQGLAGRYLTLTGAPLGQA
ncbi:hypothetical protein LC612_43055 [Nostoc sp. CHAB 5834]|nr:hypothetical protein [Nostoc sp. CHAB 5834]